MWTATRAFHAENEINLFPKDALTVQKDLPKKRAHGLEHAVRAGTDTGEHRRAEKPRGLPRGREHGPAQTNKTAAEDVGPALCIVAPCG